MSELLHQLLTLKLLDQTVVTSINPNLQNDFHPRLQTEAQEHSSDLEVRRPEHACIEGLDEIFRRTWNRASTRT